MYLVYTEVLSIREGIDKPRYADCTYHRADKHMEIDSPGQTTQSHKLIKRRFRQQTHVSNMYLVQKLQIQLAKLEMCN